MSTDDTADRARAGDDDCDLTGVPTGPPWTVDVLADLHAGRYPAETSVELRRLVAEDSWATSVLSALDTTVDQLSLLPTPRMPERLALRLDAAIAGEYRAAVDRVVPQPRQGVDQSVSASPTARQQVAGAPSPPRPRPQPQPQPQPQWRPSTLGPPVLPAPQSAGRSPVPPAATARVSGQAASGGPSVPLPDRHGAPVASLDAARTRRRRWVGGLAAAAAVIAIGTVTVASLDHSGDTGGLASASSSAPPVGGAPAPGSAGGGTNALQLDPGRLGDALQQIEGRRPVGSLQDAAVYSRCLAANAIDPSAVRGVTSAKFDGKPAAAIAVAIDATHSRVVVVGPSCGINGAADQLAAQTFTR